MLHYYGNFRDNNLGLKIAIIVMFPIAMLFVLAAYLITAVRYIFDRFTES